MRKLNGWLSTLLQEKGADIYRSKGILNIADTDDKFVFHGVHMMLQVGKASLPLAHVLLTCVGRGCSINCAAAVTPFVACARALPPAQFGSSAEGLGQPWQPGQARVNRVVFIGKDLNRQELQEGFMSCMADAGAE